MKLRNVMYIMNITIYKFYTLTVVASFFRPKTFNFIKTSLKPKYSDIFKVFCAMMIILKFPLEMERVCIQNSNYYFKITTSCRVLLIYQLGAEMESLTKTSSLNSILLKGFDLLDESY